MTNQLTIEAGATPGAGNGVHAGGKLTSLDLFSGAGGLSIGLEEAGFKTVGALDSDEDSCNTFKDILGVEPVNEPINGQDFSRFVDVDVVVGGPPCQPFSTGGKRLGADDDRDMVPAFREVVASLKPLAFLMENVAGLTVGKRKAYLEQLKKDLKDAGYRVTPALLNAAHYGVPQKRRRLFLVGLRKDRFSQPFVFPDKTHGPGTARPFVTPGDLLSKHKQIGQPNESPVVYAKNPQLRPSPYHGLLFNGGGRALHMNEPSHTILASAGGNKTHFVDTQDEVPPYHAHLMEGGEPRVGSLPGARRLSVAESALLQTFPPGKKFHGSRSSQYTQVGNAVPPKLAEAIGRQLAAHLLGA